MKQVRVIILFVAFFSVFGFCRATEDMKLSESSIGRGYIPKNGFVPDAVTAIKIAMAVLIPIYGEQTIESEHPFTATLSKEVWTIAGSVPKGQVGGVAEIRISKTSGRVLRVVHSK